LKTGLRASVGFRAGLCAAAAIAVWFAMVDVMRGTPLFSAAYMAGLVFSFTTALPATARLLAFTLLLFLGFGVIGIVVAVALERLQREPRWYMGLLIGGLLFGVAYAKGMLVFGVDVPRALGWMATVAGNIVAGLAMIAYLRVKSRRV
jgi:hypothetical protein